VLLINALLFLLVGHLVEGFLVDGFWSALGGSLVVSVTNLIVSAVTRGARGEPRRVRVPKAKDDDAIDI
jgi:putative membrane protein